MITLKSKGAKLLSRANKTVAGRLRASRALTRWVFGVRVLPGLRPQFWDYTTLVLKKALNRYGRDGARTLEVGVGESALLTLYLAKKFEVDAHGVDIDVSALAHARTTARENGVRVDLRVSDVFAACEGQFDLIFWNPPYVPSAAADLSLIGEQSDVQTNGGASGLDLIDRFVRDVGPYLAPGGHVLLGFSDFYLDREEVRSVVREHGLAVHEEVTARPNPSRVFVLSA